MRLNLIAVLLTTAVVQLNATGFAQTISIQQKGASLKQVLSLIEKQSGYYILYNSSILEDAKPVNINVKNVSLNDALEKCFSEQKLTFLIHEKMVIVKPIQHQIQQSNTVISANIRGKVADAKGRPIPGVVVKIENSNYSKSTASLQDGTYLFSSVPAGKYKMTSSFIGFSKSTKEVEVKMEKELVTNFVLEEETGELDQIVVTGYGSRKRDDLTGSISSIGSKTIENSSMLSIDQLLQGKAAGVDVMISSGMPGAASKVRIRGNSSLIGSNDPLYVIDGIPVITDKQYQFNQSTGSDVRENISALLNINMSDVESIDILKDASASAIYGSRAANGVIIITTKKGYPGQKPVINVGYDYGFQNMNNNYRPLNAREFREIMTEAATNASKSLTGFWSSLYPHMAKIINTPEEYFGTEDNNWLDIMTRPKASVGNFNISTRGGSENITYYASYSNNQNNGVLKGSGLSRDAGKLQLDAYINPKLRIGTNINVAHSITDVKQGGLNNLLAWRPDLPIYDAKGNFYIYRDQDNPLAGSTEKNKSIATSLNGSGYLEFQPIKGLFFKSSLAFSYDNSKVDRYYPSTVTMGKQYNGLGEVTIAENGNRVFDNTLSYSGIFNEKHDLNALVGASFEHLVSEFTTAVGQGYPNDGILNNLSSANKSYTVAGGGEKSGMASYFTRLNYKYDDRYLLTFTARTDGSSKFGSSNRYGFFPSGAVAWKIHNESFLNDAKWIDQLKLRTSYGLVGTSNLGNYAWRTKFISVGYGGIAGIAPENMGNPSLKWERTKMLDLGLEFSLFDYRLNGSVGYYSKYTSGLLQATTIPFSTGFNSVSRNVSAVSNKGIELELNAYVIRNDKFKWYTSVNASKNKGKIEKLNEGKVVGSYYDNNRLIEGEPMGTLWGYQAAGIFQSKAEVDQLDANALAQTQGKSKYYQTQFTDAGDIRFVDLNGDGIVDSKDQMAIGNSTPDWTGGWTNTLNILDRFSLNIFSAFSVGGKKLWNAKRIAYAFQDQNQSHLMLDRWRVDQPSTTAPRLTIGDRVGNSKVSSFWVHDYSYFKIQDIRFSYKINEKLVRKAKCSNALVFIGVSNVLTLTKYPGMSPEGYDAGMDGAFYNGSVDYTDYPMTKTWSLGLKVEI